MANWIRTLDIRDAWKQANEHEIPVFKLASVVADRLSKQAPIPDEHAENLRQELIDDFQALAEDECDSFEEFNYYMNDLYNWGDISLDGKFNGKKVCWIATNF